MRASQRKWLILKLHFAHHAPVPCMPNTIPNLSAAALKAERGSIN